MPEIAKCPVCGRIPKIKLFKPSYEFGCSGNDIITIECCGMESSFTKLWNQYAAAMRLAMAHKGWDEESGDTHIID